MTRDKDDENENEAISTRTEDNQTRRDYERASLVEREETELSSPPTLLITHSCFFFFFPVFSLVRDEVNLSKSVYLPAL